MNDIQKMKKVAIYARVSTIEQAEEGFSIDEQLRLLHEWSEDKGYEVYREYADRGISGKNIKARPALQRLLADAMKRHFEIVIVWKMNRLARNILDLLNIVTELNRHNIAFRSYSETLETETPAGRLQFHMMAAIAEFERGTIAQNVKMGMLARAREGEWNGGQVLGYDVAKTQVLGKKRLHTRLVINQSEANTVKKIFRLYTSGYGYKSIVNRLNNEGYRSKKGNPFSISTVKTILTNPVYIGIIRYNVRRNWSEKRRNDINPHPLIIKGKHEPIISEEQWDKAQTVLKNRSHTPNRVHSGEHLLTGIIKCPQCGASMVLGRTTNRNKDGTKRVIEYYVCGAWKNKGTAVCHSNGIRIDQADEYVLKQLTRLVRSERLVQDIACRINRQAKEINVPLQSEQRQIQTCLDKIEQKKKKDLELYEESILSKGELAERLAQLNQEQSNFKTRLAQLEDALDQGTRQEVSAQMIQETMHRFDHVFRQTSTREQRKRLMELLIDKITIGEGRTIETIRIHFNQELLQCLNVGGERSKQDLSPSFCVYINV
ncbi:recombinase family protein [Sporolactobacillus shoreicorticis]|uniref:Recombinase family protein n=1 Tax=Sporolactobacillus shoreicorticis TaxID=1923877 RepID=A0ABW5S8L9_9BACL|nr:recombinase family protein [Sporolactobacillus shoreicorticis]MCO7126060.1 recombinase family protein [Sporolactobacillus shoreicorticis]